MNENSKLSPSQLDIILQGAFICERPDGTKYAQWNRPPSWANVSFTRSGPLNESDLQKTSAQVLANINQGLAS